MLISIKNEIFGLYVYVCVCDIANACVGDDKLSEFDKENLLAKIR